MTPEQRFEGTRESASRYLQDRHSAKGTGRAKALGHREEVGHGAVGGRAQDKEVKVGWCPPALV